MALLSLPPSHFPNLFPTPHRQQDPKFVYYLSAEFLMGRSLLNTLYNLGIKDQYAGQQLQLFGACRDSSTRVCFAPEQSSSSSSSTDCA